MMKSKIGAVAKWFGLAALVAYYSVMALIVVLAYVSPNQHLLLSINQFGEARLELMLTILSIPCVLYLFMGGSQGHEKNREVRTLAAIEPKPKEADSNR